MVLNNHSDLTHERIPGAEPAPAWPEAKEKYQWAWELHYIGLACAFIVIALYSLTLLLVLIFKGRNRGERKSALYLNSVHILLVTFGVTRAAFLLMDPYELDLDYPLVSTRLLFGLGFPCLTSSYSLLHVGFLEISQIKLSGNKLGNKKFVFGVITSHFVVVIIADTTTALKRETALLLLVCMTFFIVWGFAISVSVLYSGIKVIRKVKKQTNIIRSYSRCRNSELTKQSDDQIFAGTSLPNRGKKTIRITLCTAVLALGLCLCNLIALIGVYNVYRGVRKTAEPWQWWSFQTIFRLIEIALAVVMGYAVTPVDLWGKNMMRRNTCTSMILHNPRSRLSTESVVVSNNFVASSRPRGLSERTGSEPRDLQVSPNLANTEVRGERNICDVINEEKLSSDGMDEALFCQSEPLQRSPPKTPTLLTLRL